MGCGSSKTIETGTITKTQRIQIVPRDSTPSGDVVLTKTNNVPYYSRSMSEPRPTKNTLATKHSTAPLRSPGSVALSAGQKKPRTDRKKRSSSCLVSVEPQRTPESRQRQTSASSRVTADSGFGEGNRTGVSAESSRTVRRESMEFIAEQSLSSDIELILNAERPTTPVLLVEGTSCLPPLKRTTTFSKLVNLSGAVDSIHQVSADTIKEKAPLPPIHTQTQRPKLNLVREQLNSPNAMELEQNLDIVERPSSKGGMAFDVLLGIPSSKKQALRPIEFNPEKIPGKKGAKKRRSTDKLTKESIDAKLAAAEKRRKEREQEIIKNLVELREVDERKVREQYERYKEKVGHKEANLGERMRTTSANRDVQISAKVDQTQREKEKSISLKPQDNAASSQD